MSGGDASQAEKRRDWCGPERSDNTAAAFRPEGSALTQRGPQAPQDRDRVRPKAGTLSARDRHRMANTPLPLFTEGRLREARNPTTGRIEPGRQSRARPKPIVILFAWQQLTQA